MSKTYVPRALIRLVRERAQRFCEYCLIHDDDSVTEGQVDHIISEKHGGETTEHNLAYACVFCNRAKGSDIGSIDWATGEFTRFFNPRFDRWREHFETDGIKLVVLRRAFYNLTRLNVLWSDKTFTRQGATRLQRRNP